MCVIRGADEELPWLTAMAGFPWTAYGVSQAFYYMKAKAENTKDGIKFETTFLERKIEESLGASLDSTEQTEDSLEEEVESGESEG